MLKLVRTALTAAILTAIAVRLRRRARQESPGQAPDHAGATPEARRPRRSGRGTPLLLGTGAVAAVALVVAAALVGPAATGGGSGAAPETVMGRERVRAGNTAPDATPITATSPAETPADASPSPRLIAPSDLVCRPRPGPPVVRPIDPRVRRAVNRQWRRIERWLKRNAPRTYATLGVPGRPREVALAEARMGVEFPDALRASLLRHDGAGRFGFLGERLFRVRQIRALWREYCRDGGGILPRENWDDKLIPVGGHVEGILLVSGEDSGSVYEIGDEYRSARPGGLKVRSYYGLLKAAADGLERGRLGERRPRVVNGALVWK
ncbi:SMI1/KNR4 family protein [Nonomuraea sp. NPDC050691]|uniref:SMI1/KNR4 family protein n=1 Tax=Nonomuraea sp. NPDC050691 TaxID=3155661 RepID=UPI0034061E52